MFMKICIVVCTVFIFIFIWNTGRAYASEGPIFELSDIKGVSTVVIAVDNGPNSVLLPAAAIDDGTGKNYRDTIFEETKRIFASQPWISTMEHSSENISKLSRSKTPYATLRYALSLRRDNVAGTSIKIAALALQIETQITHDKKSSHVIAQTPVTYTFIVPEDGLSFNGKLVSGVKYLTAHLPSYFLVANKYGYPSEACPDCSLDNMNLDPCYQPREAIPYKIDPINPTPIPK
jgi:hypothetical protein